MRRGSGEAVRLLLVLTLARRILFLFAGVGGDCHNLVFIDVSSLLLLNYISECCANFLDLLKVFIYQLVRIFVSRVYIRKYRSVTESVTSGSVTLWCHGMTGNTICVCCGGFQVAGGVPINFYGKFRVFEPDRFQSFCFHSQAQNA
jgi:hypothetical protein